MAEDYLFIYGTLRKKAGHPIHRTLEEGGRFVGEATFQGRLYDLGSHPGAVPSENSRDIVTGELYAVMRPDILRKLDGYEGGEYRRERHRIGLAGANSIEAWIYIFVASTDGARLVPSGDYLSSNE